MSFNPSSPLGIDTGSLAGDGTSTIDKIVGGGPLGAGDNKPAVSIIETPWNDKSLNKLSDSFFTPIDIDGKRWNQLYPYRLLVVDAADNYKVVSKAGSVETKAEPIKGLGYKISFKEFGNKWELQLPITPQQLQINTQFAIGVSATQKGIVEEHAGVRFKNIMCSGTMGVWPYRPSISAKLTSPTILETLFGGTLTAVSNLVGQVNTLVRSVTQNHPAPKPTSIGPEKANGGYLGTGYVYALLWDQFLEQYAEAKKDPANASWRLVFDIPKQNQSFLVTPVQFTWNQTAESPNEIKYSFQLKAWKRINLADSTVKPAENDDLVQLKPNLLQRALTAIETARRVVGDASDLVQAVRSDFQTPFNALRQISLLIKDLAGIPLTIIDLPRQIIADYESIVVQGIAQDYNDIKDIGKKTTKSWEALLGIRNGANENEGRGSGGNGGNVSGRSSSGGGGGGSGASSVSKTDTTKRIFESPEKHFDLFNSLNIFSLPLTPAQRLRIQGSLTDPSTVTVDDLLIYRQQLLDLTLQISNAFGAGDSLFSRVYSKPSPSFRSQEMTIDEYSILESLYEVIQSIDNLTATQQIDDGRIASAMEYVGGVANANDISFETSRSKIKVPVPFGLTIEEISLRYLQNSDRWIEIATLNALKSPYLDENGFIVPLLSNASGRQLNIASNTNLYLGQKLTVLSNTQISTTRRIINIEKINDTNFLISLDGLDDLEIYTTLDKARVRAYLPGTTNSQNQIFIPSDLPASDVTNTRPISGLSQDSLVGLSKVDWLLQDNGDVALDVYGDIKLAAGLTNLVQALKLKFLTPVGKLLKHPDFGVGLKAGSSSANLNASDIYRQIKNTVLADKRFSSIESLEVILNGPTLTINLSVGYNKNEVLPLTFNVNI